MILIKTKNKCAIWTVIVMFTFVAQEWVEGLGRRNITLSIQINSTKREKGSIIESGDLPWKTGG